MNEPGSVRSYVKRVGFTKEEEVGSITFFYTDGREEDICYRV